MDQLLKKLNNKIFVPGYLLRITHPIRYLVEYIIQKRYCSGGDGTLSGMTMITFLMSAVAVASNVISNINRYISIHVKFLSFFPVKSISRKILWNWFHEIFSQSSVINETTITTTTTIMTMFSMEILLTTTMLEITWMLFKFVSKYFFTKQ